VLASLAGKSLLEALPVVEGLDRRRDHGQRRPCTTRRAQSHLRRWRTRATDAVAGLRNADQNERIPGPAGPLRPRPATTRLADTGPMPSTSPTDRDPLSRHRSPAPHRRGSRTARCVGFTLAGERRTTSAASSPRRAARSGRTATPAPSRGITGAPARSVASARSGSRGRSRGWRRSGPYGAAALACSATTPASRARPRGAATGPWHHPSRRCRSAGVVAAVAYAASSRHGCADEVPPHSTSVPKRFTAEPTSRARPDASISSSSRPARREPSVPRQRLPVDAHRASSTRTACSKSARSGHACAPQPTTASTPTIGYRSGPSTSHRRTPRRAP